MLAFYIVSNYAFVILKLIKCAIDKEIYLCAVICIGILHYRHTLHTPFAVLPFNLDFLVMLSLAVCFIRKSLL
jgi:hypothetical protein